MKMFAYFATPALPLNGDKQLATLTAGHPYLLSMTIILSSQ